MLQQKTASAIKFERLRGLSFEETSVAQGWAYDKETDILYASKRRAQCAMVKGLTSPWIKLLYYDCNKAMTKEVLFGSTIRTEAAGFRTSSCAYCSWIS